jgi:hypothetical protein
MVASQVARPGFTCAAPWQSGAAILQQSIGEMNMPYWNRFDIIEAYLALEMDYNEGGLVKGKCYSGQIATLGYRPSPLFNGYSSLSDNAKEIYLDKAHSLKLITQLEWQAMRDEFYYD